MVRRSRILKRKTFSVFAQNDFGAAAAHQDPSAAGVRKARVRFEIELKGGFEINAFFWIVLEAVDLLCVCLYGQRLENCANELLKKVC